MSTSYSTASRYPERSNLAHPEMDYLAEGGVLGLIMSKIYDCRPRNSKSDSKGIGSNLESASTTALSGTVAQGLAQYPTLPLSTLTLEDDLTMPASIRLPESPEEVEYPDATDSFPATSMSPAFQWRSSNLVHRLMPDAPVSQPVVDPQKRSEPNEQRVPDPGKCTQPTTFSDVPENAQKQRLRLEILELEKVHIDETVLQHSIDWTILTSITLLQGSGHEQLWKFLRRVYSPKTSQTSINHSGPAFGSASEYRLRIRRIHSDSVSPALISFLRETLAPNSLEWMILQDRARNSSGVTIESIYRGPLRYHRSSLKKVAIDSSVPGATVGSRTSRWKRWQLNREILTFITSGKMCSLRELGMAVDYKDWVNF